MFKTLTQKLFANKFFLTATVITLIVLVLVVIFSPKYNSSSGNITPAASQVPAEFINLTEEKIKQATDYRTLVADRFPIRLRSFTTSVGLNTSIDITLHPSEPSVTRLDIGGLSYLNKDELDPAKNPNLAAFKETFNKALQLLREAGVEPKQLIFDYGQADYVKVTAAYWVDKLGLLR